MAAQVDYLASLQTKRAGPDHIPVSCSLEGIGQSATTPSQELAAQLGARLSRRSREAHLCEEDQLIVTDPVQGLFELVVACHQAVNGTQGGITYGHRLSGHWPPIWICKQRTKSVIEEHIVPEHAAEMWLPSRTRSGPLQTGTNPRLLKHSRKRGSIAKDWMLRRVRCTCDSPGVRAGDGDADGLRALPAQGVVEQEAEAGAGCRGCHGGRAHRHVQQIAVLQLPASAQRRA